jgi:hypothetical protein
MDALSLSHLTYCGATITVNFHRLDHPPFPCKCRLLRWATTSKYLRRHGCWYIRRGYKSISSLVAVRYRAERLESMKPVTIIGILLIIFGIVGYATGGLSFTHEKKVVDMGSVQISRKTQDTLPLTPILSTVFLVCGLGLVVVGSRAK